jgi:hypothetical protein
LNHLRALVNAIHLLSGDQAQWASFPGDVVRRLNSVPSGLIEQIS